MLTGPSVLASWLPRLEIIFLAGIKAPPEWFALNLQFLLLVPGRGANAAGASLENRLVHRVRGSGLAVTIVHTCL